MKKIIICFLVICTLMCGNVFAADDYTIVDMAEFAEVNIFSEGLCAAQDSTTKRWGFVDINKNWVISPKFKSASYFRNGYCAVQNVDGEQVLINHSGDVIYKSTHSVEADSEKLYLSKHGEYRVIFDYDSVSLYKNNNLILENLLKLSETFFIKGENYYNYKGIDITNHLKTSGVSLCKASNKYILGVKDDRFMVFDGNGEKTVDFYTPTSEPRNIELNGDLIIICGNYIPTLVYNIPLNKKVFDSTENAGETQIYATAYYNKYFTAKKSNGTSALYSADGNLIVDFGTWDNIYPASTANRMIAEINNKYGIVDFFGNIEIPLDFEASSLSCLINNGKTAILLNALAHNYVLFDLATLHAAYSDSFPKSYGGERMLIADSIGEEYKILDTQMNEISPDTVGLYMCYNSNEHLEQGVYQMRTNGKSYFSFLIFNDGGGVKIKLDGEKLPFDVSPIIQNGRTLVPMRAIFEALGAKVEWDEETQAITAHNKDVNVKMQIGSNTLAKNGQTTEIDVCPQLIDGRTLVPVRAISDCFNVLVDWDGYSQTVSLFTN